MATDDASLSVESALQDVSAAIIPRAVRKGAEVKLEVRAPSRITACKTDGETPVPLERLRVADGRQLVVGTLWMRAFESKTIRVSCTGDDKTVEAAVVSARVDVSDKPLTLVVTPALLDPGGTATVTLTAPLDPFYFSCVMPASVTTAINETDVAGQRVLVGVSKVKVDKSSDVRVLCGAGDRREEVVARIEVRTTGGPGDAGAPDAAPTDAAPTDAGPLSGTYELVNGLAAAIAVDPQGNAGMLGSESVPGGHPLFLRGADWVRVDGHAGVDLAMGPGGDVYLVDSANQISLRRNGTWQSMPGLARRIAVGADGTAWMLSTEAAPGGYKIYRWVGSAWVNSPGTATAIAVGPDGNPWVVTSFDEIYRNNGTTWLFVAGRGTATDIAIGTDGRVWIVGTATTGGGRRVYVSSVQGWVAKAGGGVHIAVGNGLPWLANDQGAIYRMTSE